MEMYSPACLTEWDLEQMSRAQERKAWKQRRPVELLAYEPKATCTVYKGFSNIYHWVLEPIPWPIALDLVIEETLKPQEPHSEF